MTRVQQDESVAPPQRQPWLPSAATGLGHWSFHQCARMTALLVFACMLVLPMPQGARALSYTRIGGSVPAGTYTQDTILVDGGALLSGGPMVIDVGAMPTGTPLNVTFARSSVTGTTTYIELRCPTAATAHSPLVATIGPSNAFTASGVQVSGLPPAGSVIMIFRNTHTLNADNALGSALGSMAVLLLRFALAAGAVLTVSENSVDCPPIAGPHFSYCLFLTSDYAMTVTGPGTALRITQNAFSVTQTADNTGCNAWAIAFTVQHAYTLPDTPRVTVSGGAEVLIEANVLHMTKDSGTPSAANSGCYFMLPVYFRRVTITSASRLLVRRNTVTIRALSGVDKTVGFVYFEGGSSISGSSLVEVTANNVTARLSTAVGLSLVSTIGGRLPLSDQSTLNISDNTVLAVHAAHGSPTSGLDLDVNTSGQSAVLVERNTFTASKPNTGSPIGSVVQVPAAARFQAGSRLSIADNALTFTGAGTGAFIIFDAGSVVDGGSRVEVTNNTAAATLAPSPKRPLVAGLSCVGWPTCVFAACRNRWYGALLQRRAQHVVSAVLNTAATGACSTATISAPATPSLGPGTASKAVVTHPSPSQSRDSPTASRTAAPFITPTAYVTPHTASDSAPTGLLGSASVTAGALSGASLTPTPSPLPSASPGHAPSITQEPTRTPTVTQSTAVDAATTATTTSTSVGSTSAASLPATATSTAVAPTMSSPPTTTTTTTTTTWSTSTAMVTAPRCAVGTPFHIIVPAQRLVNDRFRLRASSPPLPDGVLIAGAAFLVPTDGTGMGPVAVSVVVGGGNNSTATVFLVIEGTSHDTAAAQHATFTVPASALTAACANTTMTVGLVLPPAGTASAADVVAVALAFAVGGSVVVAPADPTAMEALAAVVVLLGPCGGPFGNSAARYAKYLLSPAIGAGPAAVVALHAGIVTAATIACGIFVVVRSRSARRRLSTTWAEHSAHNGCAPTPLRAPYSGGLPAASIALAVLLYPGTAWAAAALVREHAASSSPLGAGPTAALVVASILLITVPCACAAVVIRGLGTDWYEPVLAPVDKHRPFTTLTRRVLLPQGHWVAIGTGTTSGAAAGGATIHTAAVMTLRGLVNARGRLLGPLRCAWFVALCAAVGAPATAAGSSQCTAQLHAAAGLTGVLLVVTITARPYATHATAALSALALVLLAGLLEAQTAAHRPPHHNAPVFIAIAVTALTLLRGLHIGVLLVRAASRPAASANAIDANGDGSHEGALSVALDPHVQHTAATHTAAEKSRKPTPES